MVNRPEVAVADPDSTAPSRLDGFIAGGLRRAAADSRRPTPGIWLIIRSTASIGSCRKPRLSRSLGIASGSLPAQAAAGPASTLMAPPNATSTSRTDNTAPMARGMRMRSAAEQTVAAEA